MKPFDLQVALAGAKVVTRDGREVKIAGYNEEAEIDDKIVGWVDNECISWGCNGIYSHCIQDSNRDLFMAPTERKEWVLRSHPVGRPDYFFIVGPFTTKEEAETIAYKSGSKATIHEITIHE